ncbi:hypothetical protein BN2475_50193 [Paraburkholderia ribeironis]|uniref:Uncharacterized protein n=1 Tax=Paraburkholderia ribeironis TaxID=1247936 RepID=A0A1N7RKT1_9BURK|nr:hypothetical protein BN2475_50193 [Paraburkholderia ribeironis]
MKNGDLGSLKAMTCAFDSWWVQTAVRPSELNYQVNSMKGIGAKSGQADSGDKRLSAGTQCRCRYVRHDGARRELRERLAPNGA